MNVVSWIMAIFAVIGAIDRIFGNRLGLGREFERGLEMLGTLALAMIGMIVISPLIADLTRPLFDLVSSVIPIDPSVFAGMLFANDMGGAPLSAELAKDPAMGAFNGLVVGAMMGATVSFTIPFALGTVKKELHRELLVGLLCGIVTVPVGCLISGLIAKIPFVALLINLCPLLLFSALIAWGLFKAPDLSVKIFKIVGIGIKILITAGLAIGIFQFLTGKILVKPLAGFEEASLVIIGIAAVMTGAFPLIFLLSRLLRRPLSALGRRIGVGEVSMTGFLASLATSATTFEMMERMDRRGVVLNAAFAVSAAFAFADHLAFTLSFAPDYLPAVTIGKLVAGVLAVVLAIPIYNRTQKQASKQ